jgi:formylglycine-generating enzyme required for sulfatase activity
VWDYAAFGRLSPPTNHSEWLGVQKIIHQRTTVSTSIDRSPGRTNLRGISDMIGNVWEWCSGVSDAYERPSLTSGFGNTAEGWAPELRGGSYLDDLERTQPVVSSLMLPNGLYTSHADLGFRISALFDVGRLHIPAHVLAALAHAEFSVDDVVGRPTL